MGRRVSFHLMNSNHGERGRRRGPGARGPRPERTPSVRPDGDGRIPLLREEDPSALLFETDGLVCERVRQMMRREGMSSCAVDSTALFHRLRATLSFGLFVVGVSSPEDLVGLDLGDETDRLLLLAPIGEPGAAAVYRMSLPRARIVDRALRDPDALRAALRWSPEPVLSGGSDPVQRTFEPYGLSERQIEVLRRALLGETGAEIARGLFISELTVRNHLHAIYERVGVSGRRELLGRFVRGLLETGPRVAPPGRA